MTSSQTALAVLVATALVSSMIVTATQVRVIRHPVSWPRYVVAWIVCVLLIGGLVSWTDTMVGNAEFTRRVANFARAAGIAAIALGAGAWWTQRQWWRDHAPFARSLTLFLIHGLVMLCAYVLP